jgi:hypothetical protein
MHAIPRKDKVLSSTDTVCELHFEKHFLIEKDVITLPDGKVVEMARDRKALQTSAVPTIFPNLPKYLTKKQFHRKSPKKRIGTGTRCMTNSSCSLEDLKQRLTPLVTAAVTG